MNHHRFSCFQSLMDCIHNANLSNAERQLPLWNTVVWGQFIEQLLRVTFQHPVYKKHDCRIPLDGLHQIVKIEKLCVCVTNDHNYPLAVSLEPIGRCAVRPMHSDCCRCPRGEKANNRAAEKGQKCFEGLINVRSKVVAPGSFEMKPAVQAEKSHWLPRGGLLLSPGGGWCFFFSAETEGWLLHQCLQREFIHGKHPK